MPAPRDYLVYPDQFGEVDPPQWRNVRRPKQPNLDAAEVQHEVARKTRDQMRRLDLRSEDIAAQLDISHEQFKRLLRGESAMTLARMHQIARLVALTITVTVEPTE